MALVALPAVHSQAQVSFGVQIGPSYGIYNAPPVCEYGFYPTYPFDCAPYGYYGSNYFVNGVFIGVGPWNNFYFSHAGFYRPFYFNRGFGVREGFRGEGFRGGEFRGGEVRGNSFRGGENRSYNNGGRSYVGSNRGYNGGGGTYNGGGRSYNGGGSHGYSGGSHNSGGGSYHGGSSHGESHGGSHGDHR